MKNILFIFTFLIHVLSLRAQADQNIHVKAFDAQKYSPTVSVFVKAEKQPLLEYLQQYDGIYKYAVNGYHSVTIKSTELKNLLSQPFITGSDFTLHRPVTLNDTMRVRDNINPIHAGQNPLDTAYTGKGVLIGFIDTGIELEHGDFIDANGKTRILKIWDQQMPFDAQHTPAFYGYGQVWDSAEINAGICPHYDYGNGHGTTVAGTAAGNGLANGYHKGVAPDANIIIVGSDFGAGNWLATVADGVDYIFKIADSLQMPVVINASIGDYFGSHDGTDPSAMFIDSLIAAKPGRLMVCAAGNSGNIGNYHLRHDINADTSFTWFTYNSGSFLGYGSVFFEAYADTLDLQNAYYAVGANLPSGSFSDRGQTSFINILSHLGTTYTEQIINGGNVIATVDFYAEKQGPVYLLQVHIQEPDSNTYNFRFMTKGSGALDIWSTSVFGTSDIISTGLPSASTLPEIADYELPDSSKIIVSSFSCGQNTILVGNYYGMQSYYDYNNNLQNLGGTVGTISVNSSRGPSRDMRQKPDIAASGDIHLSAAPLYVLANMIPTEPHKVALGGMHIRNGGTSMACPVVAGIGALALQKCKWLTDDEFRTMITSTAKTDAFTGVVPNITYGHGKIDGFAALNTKNYSASLLSVSTNLICPNDSVELFADQTYDGYLWSTGETTSSIQTHDSADYHALVFDEFGCRARTDTITISFYNSTVAQISADTANALLIAGSASTYQWLFDGDTIAGATNQTLNYSATGTGIYELWISDANGCVDSALYLLTFNSIPEKGNPALVIYPNPARDHIMISVPKEMIRSAKVMDAAGKILFVQNPVTNRSETMTLDLRSLSRGIYFVEVETENGKWVQQVVKE